MQDPFLYITDPVARTLTLALEQCMQTKSIDQIRTSDILELSGVSRSTFYRRYRDKYDMINKNYQLLLDETLGEISGGMSYAQAVRAIYQVLQTAPGFYKNALSSVEPDGLRQYIFMQCYKNHVDLLDRAGIDMKDTLNRMLLTGYLAGALTITGAWADNGMKESTNELLACFYELMPDAFRKCFFVHYI